MKLVIIKALLREVKNLENENAALIKQIEDTRINKVSREVARRIEAWMDRPYEKGITEHQDVAVFALQTTRYIDQRLRD